MSGYLIVPVTFSQNLTGMLVHRGASTMNKIPATTNVSLPGIDHSHTYPYAPVFFGAPREYGPNEGWVTVVRRKKGGRKGRVVKEAHTSFP